MVSSLPKKSGLGIKWYKPPPVRKTSLTSLLLGNQDLKPDEIFNSSTISLPSIKTDNILSEPAKGPPPDIHESIYVSFHSYVYSFNKFKK